MPRDRPDVPVAAISAVIVIALAIVAARLVAIPVRSNSLPELPPPFPVTFNAPEPVYFGPHIWYNFTVNVTVSNFTWKDLRCFVVAGPLTKSETNWTLIVMDSSFGLVAAYEEFLGNWTTSSAAGVLSDDVVVLETESPLTLGYFGVTGAWYGVGGYSVELV